jgi:tetratricopeptide (TPR) repeat protein
LTKRIILILALLLSFSVFGGKGSFWGTAVCYGAESLYEERLDKGLFNTDPYSYLLIEKAHEERDRAEELLESARKYSPDLPAVYFELAMESVSPSLNGMFEGIDYFRQGLKAYERNFWWSFNLAGVVSLSIIASYLLSLCILVAIRFPMEYPLLAHDIREDRARVALLALPFFLSLFGFLVFIAGVLFLFGLYFRKRDRIVVYGVFVSLLISPLILWVSDTLLSPPSPQLRAIVAVNEGRDNRYALENLKGHDFGQAFSYALALKREGNYGAAIATYKKLAGEADPLVYNNLGNAYYAVKDLDSAKGAYERALGIRERPAPLYNLSQVYRETLDFAKGDEYFLKAARLDREAVSSFAAISGRNPNRVVVDERLPMSEIWKYAERKSASLGPSVLLAVLMIPAFSMLNRKMKTRAYRCRRCGTISCSKCSKALTWGGMCPQCYQFFVKVEELDPHARISRLVSIHEGQTKRRRILKLLSAFIPGTGQIYAGKIVIGFLFLWLFLFSLALIVMSRLSFVGIFPYSQGWMIPFAVLGLVLAYVLSIFNVKKGIRRGWL